MAMLEKILRKRQKLQGNIFSDITFPFLKQLTWHAELGYDISYSKADTFNPSVDLGAYKRAANDIRSQKNNSTYWQIKNYLTYANSFGKHNITAMVGQEAWASRWDYMSVSNTSLPSNEVMNPSLGTGTPVIGYGYGSSSMASFFTRESYNFDNRYIATYTFRYDGSSNCGPSNRWAPFHSFAIAWRFTNEAFMKGAKDILSDGKIRVGWGQTGNASIGSYKWGAAMESVGTGIGRGYRQANLPNPGIKWEKQVQTNVGLDLSFFHNRLALTVDWYDKRSNDMLMPLQLPSYMGTLGNESSRLQAPWGNYGSIKNTGVEITLTAHPVETKDFHWTSEGQISFNRNKLVALSGTASAAIVGYGQWSDIVSQSVIGEPLFSFYGYQTDGIFQSIEEVMAGPVQGDTMPHTVDADGVWHPSQDIADYNQYNTTWVGDIRFKDINKDGRITEADRTNIGSPMPKFTFGWTNTFVYKNWDLSIFINGSYGNKVLNYLNMKVGNMKSAWANQPSSVLGRTRLEAIDPEKTYDGTNNVWNWFEDPENVRIANPGATLPRATTGDPNDNDRLSDRYIEDGSYLRVKNITLGYTFPKRIIQKARIDNLRLQVNIQNLLTFTKYTGYDPEIGASTASVNVMGLDNGRYPSPTAYSFGVNITF
jgi:TonB-linked SusC/RagA family outer membrane protein